MKTTNFTKFKKTIFCTILAVIISVLAACNPAGLTDNGNLPGGNPSPGVQVDFLNYITKLIGFDDDNGKAAHSEIVSYLTEFEQEISIAINSSDISRLNNAAAGQHIQVGDTALELIKMSLEVYRLSEGAFNPFLVRLSDIWGFLPAGNGDYRIPGGTEIADALEYATPDADTVFTFYDNNMVAKSHDGIMLDLGAIAKGYVLEKCRDIAASHGVTSGIINIGGNIYTIGEKSGGALYKIGITHPRNTEYSKEYNYFAVAQLKDTSISTSGDYERYFIRDGKRYCHIFDASTGMPVDNGVTSVVVIMENGALADAYSTAAMVKGADAGIKFLRDNNINAIIITADLKYYLSGVALSVLTEISDKYTPG